MDNQNNEIKVVNVINENTIVINKGAQDHIKLTDKFLIFEIGEEIIDPDTTSSLGFLEIVKGKAIVEHIQEKMSTLKSNNFSFTPKRIIKKSPPSLFSIYNNETIEEIESSKELLPFPKEIKIGDFAKKIK